MRILDGGMGDILSERVGRKHESDWSASCLTHSANHHLVVQLHQEYIQCGAEWITTANFSLRRDHGYSDGEIYSGCLAAATLAKQAVAATSAKVLGSLPPLGQCFLHKPVLHSSTQYDCMISGLASCDWFLGETMSSLDEIMLVYDALERNQVEREWMVSFPVTARGTLYSGESCGQVVEHLLRLPKPPKAILINCSPPEYITTALESLVDWLRSIATMCPRKPLQHFVSTAPVG
ncbi:hypothetical protein BASA81_012108 [Batrachochytrium salamandrivorans]|nr:hypothetical protein BASA81_012108 [Batrachochytrium salamandrivorans]